MSLQMLITSAARRIGIPMATGAAVSTSADASVLLMLELAQEEGRDLARRHPWTALVTEKTFTTVAAAAQTGAISSDFDRFVADTMFNRTTNQAIEGPLTAGEWQDLQASAVSRIYGAFRVRGSSLLFSPTPTAGQTIAYEYVSRNFCRSASGSPQSAWAADSDVGALDENLISLGVEWRFRERKGFPADAARRTYERQVADAILRDGGQRTIDTNRRVGGYHFEAARRRTWPGQVV